MSFLLLRFPHSWRKGKRKKERERERGKGQVNRREGGRKSYYTSFYYPLPFPLPLLHQCVLLHNIFFACFEDPANLQLSITNFVKRKSFVSNTFFVEDETRVVKTCYKH